MRAPATLRKSLDLLALGDLAGASAAAETFRREHPGAAEAEVLVALIQRRAGEESWLDSFLNAWAAVGKPTAFEFFRNEGIDEWGERLSRSLTEGDTDAAPKIHGPLMALLLGRSHDIDGEMRRAAAGSTQATTVVDCLWYLALLADRRVSPETLAIAYRARASLLERLVQLRPDDFMIRSLATLERESEVGLSAQGTEDLLRTVETCPRSLELSEIYGSLRSARASETSAERAACLEDAMAMLPSLVSIAVRARASAGESHSGRVNALLREVGNRFCGASSLERRLIALSMLELAHKSEESAVELRNAQAKLELTRRVAAPERRLSLDWPLEPLAREVCDAVAADEFGLFERCLFPTS